MAIRTTQLHYNLIVPRILFRATQVGYSIIAFVDKPPDWFVRKAVRSRIIRPGIL